MKKILLLLLFINSLAIKAQTYNFDYTLKIEGVDKRSKKSVGNTVLMINSQDPTYGIEIRDNIGGTLSKYPQSTIYNFRVIKNRKGVDYKFTGSLKYTPVEEIKIDHITVEKIEEEKYILKIFNKPKNKNVEIIIILKPADSDLVRFYHLDYNYNIRTQIINALKKELKGEKKYFISEYTIKNNQGFFGHYKVSKIENVNLEVINPLE